MKKNILTSALCLMLIFVASCSSDSSDDLEPVPEPAPTNTTYTNTVKAIMSQSCATSACHDSTSPSAGLNLTNYTNVKDAFVNKNALGLINSGSMPKNASKLPAVTIAKITDWIDNNYEE